MPAAVYNWSKKISRLALSLALAMAWLGCGPSKEEIRAKEKADQLASAKSAMETARAELLAKRVELETAKAALSAPGSPAGGSAEQKARVETLGKEEDQLTSDFVRAIVDFVTASDLARGAVMTSDQRLAVDYMVEEQSRVAREYIDVAGDYRRAIEIYEQLLHSDPGNARVLAAKAEAEKLRYMDSGRFEQVKPGMTQLEVRALLGQPTRDNMKQYWDRGLRAWYYPREGGLIAGVFYREKIKGSGEWTVQLTQFEVELAD